MSTYVKFAEETGDRYLAALEKGQESFLKYIAAANQWTPRPAGTMPGVSTLQAFSVAGFEFSEKLLEQQKAFADKLFAQAQSKSKPAAKAPPIKAVPSASKSARPAVVRSSKKKPATRTQPTAAGKSEAGKS